ncbi:MAG: AzlC family ABC transporter permease [Lachnospiraceae bacterium]|nr:AzlC family ABC transporter permease [Lachnospiraceae bacterium]
MSAQSGKSQYLQGLRDGLPVILGVFPVGIAFAVIARQAGWSAAESLAMSAFVFAGASQMMAAGMYIQGASLFAIILATFILNLRHLIMSTCISNRMRRTPAALKLLAAFGVCDETFAIFSTAEKSKCSLPYFLGLFGTVYFPWVLGTAAGIVASEFLPPSLTASLGIALYAMFIGLLMPGLTRSKKLAALVLLTALCNFFLSRCMASSWALIFSTLICAAVGAAFPDPEEEKETANDKL